VTPAANVRLPAARQGDTYGPFAVQLLFADGTPLPVAGATAKCQVRDVPADQPGSAVLLTLCDGPPDAAGRWALAAPAAATLAAAAGPWPFDFRVTYPDGRVVTYFEGRLPVGRSVTR